MKMRTKMVNEYVRECKIGAGSYGKVVLYLSLADGKHYAINAFHKSHLIKLRVAPSKTAMTDVLREIICTAIQSFILKYYYWMFLTCTNCTSISIATSNTLSKQFSLLFVVFVTLCAEPFVFLTFFSNDL